MSLCYPELVGHQPSGAGNYADMMGVDGDKAYYWYYDTSSIVEVAIGDLETVLRSWEVPFTNTDPNGPYESHWSYDGAVGPGKVFHVVESETYDGTNWVYSKVIRCLDTATGTHTDVHTVAEGGTPEYYFTGYLAYGHHDGHIYFTLYDASTGAGVLRKVSLGGAATTVVSAVHADVGTRSVDLYAPQFTSGGAYLWFAWNSDDGVWPVWASQRGVARYDVGADAFTFHSVDPAHIPPDGAGAPASGYVWTNGSTVAFAWYHNESDGSGGDDYYTHLYLFDEAGVGTHVQTVLNGEIDRTTYDLVVPPALVEGTLVEPELLFAGKFTDGGSWSSGATSSKQDAEGVGWFTGRQHLFRYPVCTQPAGCIMTLGSRVLAVPVSGGNDWAVCCLGGV